MTDETVKVNDVPKRIPVMEWDTNWDIDVKEQGVQELGTARETRACMTTQATDEGSSRRSGQKCKCRLKRKTKTKKLVIPKQCQ